MSMINFNHRPVGAASWGEVMSGFQPVQPSWALSKLHAQDKEQKARSRDGMLAGAMDAVIRDRDNEAALERDQLAIDANDDTNKKLLAAKLLTGGLGGVGGASRGLAANQVLTNATRPLGADLSEDLGGVNDFLGQFLRFGQQATAPAAGSRKMAGAALEGMPGYS